ncbi:Glycosyltransferase involved in cell wall bisynthesis [Mesorhizobium albiziae]|uniref:Glycosyltransferase involved in cell wall bisynthesis n=1 Tax=Neomesorhizobium albiziae TaxID=335020 RepID=A0A1I3XK45_9HYPH|nr:glycosyltransferase family 4 protein [Mesorhizobium albiziae]GLS30379.1 hypothetical protein GCM10007937_20870 [Mesorhizobium albiziae]SFK19850.1 Glycosyltransferase involved in cell wall bisynthesis [Mesorhizobium albiziae]
MNILVYPHQLIVGGSQINAIELAAAVRDRGHGVIVTAPEGPLVSMIKEFDLEYMPTPVISTYPSPRTALRMIQLVLKRRIDVVHAYEWRPSIEATFGPHLLCNTPVLMTVLSMRVPDFLPRHVPLLVGTRELVSGLERDAALMEPPIDTEKNRSVDRASARARWCFSEEEIVISVVCRMTSELQKLEGVLEAMDAVLSLADRWPVRFLVVGGGEGLAEVREKACWINGRAGRELVLVTDTMLDPRDAYEAADIVLGMGSSALKGMSFSRPLIVQGTDGFWRLLDESSTDVFLHQGWFGHGGGGAADLQEILEGLAGNPGRRTELGRHGRALVEKHFSLDSAAERLSDIYHDLVASRRSLTDRLPSLSRSAVEVAKFRTLMGFRSSKQTVSAWMAR